MGYELHITRADTSWASEEAPIPLAEWLDYARSAPALTECGWIDWEDVGRVPVYAFTCTDGAEVSLSWLEGRVSVKGIRSDSGAADVLAIADALGANLVGDDGERYTSTGAVLP